MQTIVTGDKADMADLVLFLATYKDGVKVIESGRALFKIRPARALEAAARALRENVPMDWQPWRLGTCGKLPAISVTDTWHVTRWLVPERNGQ